MSVAQLQGLIGLLGRAGDLKADGVHEFVHKELVGLMRHVLLLRQDLVVATLDEVLLKGHWDSDEDIIVLLLNWDQLDLCVILGYLIVGQQVH